MKRSIFAELAALLKAPADGAELALERRLAELERPPPIAELIELGARARRERATDEEVTLAVAALVALYAPRAGAFVH